MGHHAFGTSWDANLALTKGSFIALSGGTRTQRKARRLLNIFFCL